MYKRQDYTITFPAGRAPIHETLTAGTMRVVPLAVDEEATLSLKPTRQVDCGAGRGIPVERRVRGGVVGVMLDGRGRPLQLPPKADERVRALKQWHEALDLYP